jgi:CrcB protein
MQPLSFPYASLIVAMGGGAGAWLRFLVGRATVGLLGPVRATQFPWGTLTCNVAGSLAMGLLAGWLARHGTGGEFWRMLLGVGVLGGFTTFSAFSLEFAVLIERGAPALAAGYVALSLATSFAGLFAGLYMMRSIA